MEFKTNINELTMFRFTIFIVLFCLHFSVRAELLPVEAFGRLPHAEQLKLSPNGNQVAYIRNESGYTLIGVKDLVTRDSNFLIKTDNKKFKINWYRWANDEVLLVALDYPVKRHRAKFKESRLLKIRVDKKVPDDLVFKPRKNEHKPQLQTTIVDILPDEPNFILMSLDLKHANLPGVYKVDLRDKNTRQLLISSKPNIHGWMTDRQHRVRLGFGRDDTKVFYRLFDLKSQEWRNIWEYEIFDTPDIRPLGFALNPNQLYIRAPYKDRYGIFIVDLSLPNLPRELIYSDERYDVDGALIYSKISNDVIGFYHSGADNAKVFFDDNYAKFQQLLNTTFPDSFNNISSLSGDENKYVLFSRPADSPAAYYIGDRKNKSIEFLFDRYPLLNNKKLSGKKIIEFKARDGLNIEGYVTLPYGGIKENSPALIIPHGGPMSRTYGDFDWMSQFFASRGYTVLQPNFRGSSGYGFDFAMESIQNWGGAMQHDLADAAHWLVENYTIDKGRICILGASYGGYAALMAAAKQQDVFRCAASFAGVSDLRFVVRESRGFTNSSVVKKQIGNDFIRLKKQSPIALSEQINIPVLLIHGENDRVVDVRHSQEMYDELKSFAKNVEYFELKDGNHYLEIEGNRLETLRHFEKFLSKYLKPSPHTLN